MDEENNTPAEESTPTSDAFLDGWGTDGAESSETPEAESPESNTDETPEPETQEPTQEAAAEKPDASAAPETPPAEKPEKPVAPAPEAPKTWDGWCAVPGNTPPTDAPAFSGAWSGILGASETLLCAFGGVIFKVNPSDWTSAAVGTCTQDKTSFFGFGGKVYLLNGHGCRFFNNLW